MEKEKISNPLSPNANELYIDRDIMVLANPEIANLPDWVYRSCRSRWAGCRTFYSGGIVASNIHIYFSRSFKKNVFEKHYR